VTVSLTGMSCDLDLIVVRGGAGGGCDPRDCVAASSTQGDEHVTFMADAAETYYLIVDGYESNSGEFTLQVSCP
jgi:hypothetical protein